ncbi:hypothetical protein K492DRAFT_185401 [Lichtheimia hyalospora FSU 10163]|nr:hypothetical protein K492DRAFT_185401 [Lichtheimia hyalospora FSU 10163]
MIVSHNIFFYPSPNSWRARMVKQKHAIELANDIFGRFGSAFKFVKIKTDYCEHNQDAFAVNVTMVVALQMALFEFHERIALLVASHRDYKLPEEEIVILGNKSLSESFQKLADLLSQSITMQNRVIAQIIHAKYLGS